VVLFQNCVRHFRPPTKMAATAERVWLELIQWFLKRRFLCEFPIGFYVKLSSAVGAILVEGPNRWTHFWKRTIQWLFHQNLVLIEQMVSYKKIFMGISHRVLC
jgi:peptidoglycan/LPS O-acetylase OafA/YrhL